MHQLLVDLVVIFVTATIGRVIGLSLRRGYPQAIPGDEALTIRRSPFSKLTVAWSQIKYILDLADGVVVSHAGKLTTLRLSGDARVEFDRLAKANHVPRLFDTVLSAKIRRTITKQILQKQLRPVRDLLTSKLQISPLEANRLVIILTLDLKKQPA